MTQADINQAIAARAREGEVLTAAELVALDAADVLSLGMLADEVRRARVGDTVGYTRVLDIDAASALESLDALLHDAGEVRIAELGPSLAATVEFVERVRGAIGDGKRLAGFSLAAVLARSWGPAVDVLTALRHAGLDAVVDAPVDLVAPEDVQAVVTAGLEVGTLSLQRTSAGGRVGLLMRVRDVCQRVPGLATLSPLAREQSVATPTTGYHDVRMVALARLALPDVPVIQVDWQQYGPKLAQVALTFGANHLDHVSLIDDPSLGHRRSSVEDVRRNIASAGLTPVERGPGA